MQDPAYVLGHSQREVSRLRDQARLLEPITRSFLEAAGLAPGMSALDIGSVPAMSHSSPPSWSARPER